MAPSKVKFKKKSDINFSRHLSEYLEETFGNNQKKNGCVYLYKYIIYNDENF